MFVNCVDRDNPLQGGCLCGEVRYEIQSNPLSVCRCHCVSCRKATGSAGVVWAIVDRVHFRLLGAALCEFVSSSGVTRSFCPRCGSSLTYATVDQPGTIDVTVATLDHPELLTPTAECWLSDALPWESIDPVLAHFAQDTP